MREIRVFAPAKINLYLDVLNKRQDGFHNIETLFEKIDLQDEIIIKEKGRGIKVSTDKVDCLSEDNIVCKIARKICQELNIDLNLDIEIKKHIPVSAGLGGGSSDAAMALRSINEIFGLGMSKKQIFSIASDIGKDVPFFMMDDAFMAARGAGEILEPVKTTHSLFHIVVKPKISISTAEMYKRIDDNKESKEKGNLKAVIKAVEAKDITSLERNYFNIFEKVLGGHAGCVDEIKTLLYKAGARASLLSGSGSSVFCTFPDKDEAGFVMKKIPKSKDMDIFLVETYKGVLWR